MTTQVLEARAGNITEEMQKVAEYEQLPVEFIQEGIAKGSIVIPINQNRKKYKKIRPCGIGAGLTVKINALYGTSSDRDSYEFEGIKLRAAEAAGCNSVMDLSTGGDIDAMRKFSLENANVAVGCVPLYQAGIESIEKNGNIVKMDPEDIFAIIEKQAADGMDFMAVHAALNMTVLDQLQKTGRVTDVVSRGGSFMTGWMLHNEKENPLYEQFDRVLEIMKKYDVVLSVGDAIRPGSLADSLDAAQIAGLIVAGELVKRAQEAGVQVMVEGPGHVPLHHVDTTILLQKRLCHNAPYYILGTLATDIAPGYDHLTAAIGGAYAGYVGADFLCYVTPAEHLGLPTDEDVKQGILAIKMAAHAVNIARKKTSSQAKDLAMAQARVALDFDKQLSFAIDPEKARAIKAKQPQQDGCAMCGTNCASDVAAKYFGIA
ncbi:B12 lower ligand biosynthesis ThiC-like protein BzaB [Bacillota bacterium LX-D]|nr:B12 lower ligand biosynthesis ThiC-like protein BzaB [Bacillota bacterium LX-D]